MQRIENDDKAQDEAPPERELGWWESAKLWAFEKAAAVFGAPGKAILDFLRNAGGLLIDSIYDFPAFVTTLIRAIQQGFTQFGQNFRQHLMTGLAVFLAGSLVKAGVSPPTDLSLKSIVKVVLEALGISVSGLRQRLAKRIGEENVARLERTWDVLSSILGGGLGGLAGGLVAYLGDLKTMVIDGIKVWLVTNVIQAGLKKLATLFVPGGGLVTLIQTVIKVVTFLRDRAAQVASLFKVVSDSAVPLARGDVKKTADRVEYALALTLPLTINFLAEFLGLGGIGKVIKNVLRKGGELVNKAIDKVIEMATSTWRRIFGRGREPAKKLEDPKLEKKRRRKAIEDVLDSADRLQGPRKRLFGKERKAVTREQILNLLAGKKKEHGFTVLRLMTPEGTPQVIIDAGFSPGEKVEPKQIVMDDPENSIVVRGDKTGRFEIVEKSTGVIFGVFRSSHGAIAGFITKEPIDEKGDVILNIVGKRITYHAFAKLIKEHEVLYNYKPLSFRGRLSGTNKKWYLQNYFTDLFSDEITWEEECEAIEYAFARTSYCKALRDVGYGDVTLLAPEEPGEVPTVLDIREIKGQQDGQDKELRIKVELGARSRNRR